MVVKKVNQSSAGRTLSPQKAEQSCWLEQERPHCITSPLIMLSLPWLAGR